VHAQRLKRPLNGVLMLDKAPGASSNAALQQAKRLYQAAKAGHAGTLDPLATGLLPILFGEATKFSSDLLQADKSYAAEIQLGVSTTTADAEGEMIAERVVRVTADELAAALLHFHGSILQTPPLYSALKHAGKPLYAYARAGIQIERAPRRVTLHALELQWFEGTRLALSVSCSKGTYIRSIAHDLGEILGCGAHLAALRRTAVGGFGLDCAHTLASLEAMPAPERDGLVAGRCSAAEPARSAPEPAQQLRAGAGGAMGRAAARACALRRQRGLLGVGEAGADRTPHPTRVIAAFRCAPALRRHKNGQS
jgi:tRNA pseudouridine55 synthase